MSGPSVGGTPTGMAGGSAHQPRPLKLLPHLLLVLLHGVDAVTCHKCYQIIYTCTVTKSVLWTHTHMDSACYHQAKVEICEERGHAYWLAKNVGKYEQRSSGECQEGEKWVCFEHTNKCWRKKNPR